MKDLYGKTEKHQHKLTNLLKYCIFAMVMLAPFFAILSKMIYVSANKNAKDSYYGETINEEQKIPITNVNIYGKYYWVFNNDYQVGAERPGISFTANVLDVENWTGTEERKQEILTSTQFTIWYDPTYQSNYLSGNNFTSNIGSATAKYIYFELLSINSNYTTEDYFGNNIYEIRYNKDSYLDNAFYYALEQSKNEELLKWTKNTPIYNVINAMNTGFGLSNNHILTYLLTYWSIMIAIYIIFDILIFALTKLTHWLQ